MAIFGNTVTQKKTLTNILAVFNTAKEELNIFVKDTEADLKRIEEEKYTKSHELTQATGALAQISKIVPDKG